MHALERFTARPSATTVRSFCSAPRPIRPRRSPSPERGGRRAQCIVETGGVARRSHLRHRGAARGAAGRGRDRLAERRRCGQPRYAAAASSFAEGLMSCVRCQMFAKPEDRRAPLLLPPEIDGEHLTVTACRASPGAQQPMAVKALGPARRKVLSETSLDLGKDQRPAPKPRFGLPIELSNRIARFELEPRTRSAASYCSTNAGGGASSGWWGRSAAQSPQPLSKLFYIERALTLGQRCATARSQD